MLMIAWPGSDNHIQSFFYQITIRSAHATDGFPDEELFESICGTSTRPPPPHPLHHQHHCLNWMVEVTRGPLQAPRTDHCDQDPIRCALLGWRPSTCQTPIMDLSRICAALQQSFWMLWIKQMWWNRAVQCLPVKCHGVELLLSIKGKDRSLKCAFNYRTFSVVVHQCWFVNRLTKPHINSERGGWMCHHQSELLAASLGGYSNNWNLSVHMLWVLIQMAFKNLSFET